MNDLDEAPANSPQVHNTTATPQADTGYVAKNDPQPTSPPAEEATGEDKGAECSVLAPMRLYPDQNAASRIVAAAISASGNFNIFQSGHRQTAVNLYKELLAVEG